MKKKQWIPGLIVALLLVALVAYARTKIQFDWKTFASQMENVNWLRLMLATAFIYGAYSLRSVRWALFLRPVQKVGWFTLTGSQVIGFTAIALFGRIAELVRPYLVSKRVKRTLSSQIAVCVVERMFDLGAMALIFSLSLLLAQHENLPHKELLNRIAQSGLIGTLLLAVFALLVRFSGEAIASFVERTFGGKKQHSLAHGFAHKIRSFREGLNTLRGPMDVIYAGAISVAMWGLIACSYLETTRAFVSSPILANMTLAQCMVLMASSMVGSSIQLPIVGWFTQIGIVSAAMRNIFGVAWEPALGCGAVLLIINFLAVIPVGLIWARFEHVSLRKVAEESEIEGEVLAEE